MSFQLLLLRACGVFHAVYISHLESCARPKRTLHPSARPTVAQEKGYALRLSLVQCTRTLLTRLLHGHSYCSSFSGSLVNILCSQLCTAPLVDEVGSIVLGVLSGVGI